MTVDEQSLMSLLTTADKTLNQSQELSMSTAKLNSTIDAPAERRADRTAEARVSLPTGRMILGVTAPMMLFVAAWMIAAKLGFIGGWGSEVFISGLIVAAAVAVVAIGGVLIMTPWKSRAIADWMTMWLGSTVFRLLVTPGVVYLLYSAASRDLAVKPLVLSVASTYLVTLLTEAVILSTHIRRSLPSA